FCLNPTGNEVPPGASRFADFSDVCPSVAAGTSDVDPGGAALFTRAKYPDCPGQPTSAGTFQTFEGNLVPVDARSAAILDTNLIPPKLEHRMQLHHRVLLRCNGVASDD